ncbi:hypothetical protein [Streptomyces vinaceus]|uniref:hypothetical protein n=1 Tax=Streptomyces vinaceus TaxID=1960 RepID=UPI003682D9AC
MAHYLDHTAVARKMLDQQNDINRLTAERDGAYRERARLVAHLASLYPSHIGHTDPAAPDWAVITIEAPTGQMCWHIAPADLPLFDHVQTTYPGWGNQYIWDGHTTEQKYERLHELTVRPAKGL